MFSLLLALPLLSPQAPPEQSPITHELHEVIGVAPLEHHRAYVVMTNRLSQADLRNKVGALGGDQKQKLVVDTLRDHAASSQAGLQALIDVLTLEGHISFSEVLWITNSHRLAGDRIAIEAIAKLSGVSYIQYDPLRDQNELHDLPLSAAIQQSTAPKSSGNNNGRATTYYFEDFESGSLGSEWATSTTACGRVQVTGNHSPYAGSMHFVCDSDSNGCYSTATLTLSVDLTGKTNVDLRYAFQDMNDEFNSGSDILEASDDGGATWAKVADLTGTDGVYVLKTHDLDVLGLSYNANFKLRWSWYDNYSAATDGFGFDNIELADYFPPPPPPTPEINLVKHQAPDLWNIGIDGSGAVLLNIDSGTDPNHPDLINRIWTNPNDPADGIDNDGNGYIDDTWGWNFSSNNNNPNGGGHGTNTAGIMVGDGASGTRATGMAPGASLAVCQVSAESDHWAALQWGMSVGVNSSSSSYSWKWPYSPRPDYHMHRAVSEMVYMAEQIHCNSIGNQGGSSSYPIPFNISAPGNVPGPWVHPQQVDGGVAAVLGCCGVSVGDDSYYTPSGRGPAAWEDIFTYDSTYPHVQNPAYWDYPAGGWGLSQPGLLKPDIAGYTNGCYTTADGGGYSSFSGTSCATPHIGGATALMVSANANALPRHISKALQTTAIDRGPAGKDLEWGAGVAQVYDAALRLIHLAIPDTLEPTLGSTVRVTLSGPPNATYGLFYSMSLGATTLPGIGDLELNNANLAQAGTLNASGLGWFSGVVPNNPALSGQSIYIQSVCNDTAGATGLALFSLVEELEVQ